MLMHGQSFRILPGDVVDGAAWGENLLHPVKAAGEHLDVSCSPEGLCGKCRLMKRNHIQCEKTDKIFPDGYEWGYGSARNSIGTSLEVEIPQESRLEGDVLHEHHDIPSWEPVVSTDGKTLVTGGPFNSTPREKYREMESQTIEDQICEYPSIMIYFLASLFLPPTQSSCLPAVTEFSEIECRCKSAITMEDVR
jgi:hypothetical protein